MAAEVIVLDLNGEKLIVGDDTEAVTKMVALINELHTFKNDLNTILASLDTKHLYAIGGVLTDYALTHHTSVDDDLTMADGNSQEFTMAANSTLTLAGTTNNEVSELLFNLKGGDTYSMTWPGSFTWLTNNGSAPVLGASDWFVIFTADNGTNWLAFHLGAG